MAEKAFITGVATDQGNGSCWCSKCGHCLDYATQRWHETTMRLVEVNIKHLDNKELFEKAPEDHYKCPGCGAELQWGEISAYPFGGSDF